VSTAAPFAPGSVIVSCQAQAGSPFHGPTGMTLMARAAVLGGAAGIRANGPDDIRAIKAAVDVPVIGIWKTGHPDGVYITPTFEAAATIVEAGADVVALDATGRPREDGSTSAELIARIRAELGVPVMADVDTVAAGVAAAESGADLVASTLAGYTAATAEPATDAPDLRLVHGLGTRAGVPVVAEGRYRTPEDVRRAFIAGAVAVVVGTAVTNPTAITEWLRRGATGGPR
jgi:N-acylglucosamine-6-phosphate 2-epimerase